jgi:excisionase family DNA binding protein
MAPTTPSDSPTPTRRWASRAATAAYLGIAARTLDDLINRGTLRAYRLGPKLIRLDLNEVDALLVPLESAADRLPVRPTVRKFRGDTGKQ